MGLVLGMLLGMLFGDNPIDRHPIDFCSLELTAISASPASMTSLLLWREKRGGVSVYGVKDFEYAYARREPLTRKSDQRSWREEVEEVEVGAVEAEKEVEEEAVDDWS